MIYLCISWTVFLIVLYSFISGYYDIDLILIIIGLRVVAGYSIGLVLTVLLKYTNILSFFNINISVYEGAIYIGSIIVTGFIVFNLI